MLDFSISSKTLRYISEQVALMNSPEIQQQIKFFNSSEYREMIRFWNSPETQESLRFWNSPEIQELIQLANSFRTQERTNPDISVSVQKDTLTSLRTVVTPLIPEESREKFNEITSIEHGKGWKILTVENFKWLLGMIFSLISLIVSIYQTWRKAPAFRHGDISHTSFSRIQHYGACVRFRCVLSCFW